MSFYRINQLSQFAFEILEAAYPAKIHSIYRKTINLDVNGQLLALQVEGSPLSPISLIADMTQEDMDDLNLTLHQELLIERQELFLASKNTSSRKFLSYKEAQPVDLSLTPCASKTDLDLLKNTIRKAIASSDTKGFDLIFNHSDEADNNLILKAAKNHLLTIQEMAKAPKPSLSEITKELAHLIGLGIGLTPSGDDFLTGILAGLILCDQDQSPFALKLKEEVHKHLQDTNDISRAFLSCALKGQFSQALKMLQEHPDIDAASLQENFLKIGHSSGIDTLCGIYFYLNTLCIIK